MSAAQAKGVKKASCVEMSGKWPGEHSLLTVWPSTIHTTQERPPSSLDKAP